MEGAKCTFYMSKMCKEAPPWALATLLIYYLVGIKAGWHDGRDNEALGVIRKEDWLCQYPCSV